MENMLFGKGRKLLHIKSNIIIDNVRFVIIYISWKYMFSIKRERVKNILYFEISWNFQIRQIFYPCFETLIISKLILNNNVQWLKIDQISET